MRNIPTSVRPSFPQQIMMIAGVEAYDRWRAECAQKVSNDNLLPS